MDDALWGDSVEIAKHLRALAPQEYGGRGNPRYWMLEAATTLENVHAVFIDERGRREAAEGIIRNIRNRGVGRWVASAIDIHFARYEKEPT